VGSDGSSLYDRINRYGKAGWYRDEALTFEGKTAKDIVMDLYVSEFEPNRRSVMHPNYKKVGVFTCNLN
jgi:uncharacterized protein YkwD